MYKIMTLSTLLLGLALAPVLSSVGDATDNRPIHSIDTVATTEPMDELPADEPSSCEWSCGACEPGQNCTQMCTEVGDCGNSCGVTAHCASGFGWDDASCSCV
jgi:hypothetical protein